MSHLLFILYTSISLFSSELTKWQREIVRFYSPKFSVDTRGIPKITVGIKSGLNSVGLVLRGRTKVRFYPRSEGEARTVYLEKGFYQISVRWGRPGRWYYSVAPFILEKKSKIKWEKISNLWKKRGFFVTPYTVGSSFSLGERVFDNRRTAGVIALFPSAEKAYRWARALEKRWRDHFFVIPKLVLIPSIQLILRGRGKRLFSYGLFYFEGGRRPVEFPARLLGVKPPPGRLSLAYRGDIAVLPDRNGKIALINVVSLPDYLAGVLPSEMPLWAPREALRAQTVCARSEILSKVGLRHLRDPYLFCGEVHCQVYRGIHVRESRAAQLVWSTRGRVLVRSDGAISNASYSAICGGHTENNEFVWGGEPDPSLRGRPDLYSKSLRGQKFGFPLNSQLQIWRWLLEPPKAYCNLLKGPNRRLFRWRRELRELRPALLKRRYPELAGISPFKISDIQVLGRGVSGRAYKLSLSVKIPSSSSVRKIVISGELNIRRLFGGLPSSMFSVRRSGGKVRSGGSLSTAGTGRRRWEFVGGGWGHGVGMCQYGAMGRALRGYDYRQILKSYFSSVKIEKLF